MSIYLSSIVVLIIFSAFFSASETAYTSLNHNRIKALAERGNYLARLTLRLYEDFDQLLSTILVGNNIVNICAASVCSLMCIQYFTHLGITLPTAILTFDILLFGEITPKSFAKEYSERFAMFAALPLMVFKTILWPVNALFGMWKRFLARSLKFKNDTKISQEELLMMVDEVQQDGGIDKNEGTLLKNAIKFTECRVEEILTHRVDIAGVPLDATREEVGALFASTQYSRLVVYAESLDNIVGVVVLKDFYASAKNPQWDIRAIMTPPFLTQKTERIDDVLRHLQQSRAQIAVVLDEFGGTLGLVTVEDILEELVGEIWDEHDEVEEKFKEIGPNTYRVDGAISLDDFQEFFHIKVDSKETLLSGWVLEHLQKIPQKGDHFVCENLEIAVVYCTRHRIRQLEIRKLPHTPEEIE